MDKIDKNYAISSKIYDLIYELNLINPNILCSILPQLECKLKATNESERLSMLYIYIYVYAFIIIYYLFQQRLFHY